LLPEASHHCPSLLLQAGETRKLRKALAAGDRLAGGTRWSREARLRPNVSDRRGRKEVNETGGVLITSPRPAGVERMEVANSVWFGD